VFIVADQICISELFISRLIADRQTISKVEPYPNCKLSSQLDEFPIALSELSQWSPEIGACAEFMNWVRWQMDDLLRKGMSFGFSDDMSEARVLVDQNRLLMQQLHERKEEARRHKQGVIQTEQGLIAQRRK
jgi:hypothetical protein